MSEHQARDALRRIAYLRPGGPITGSRAYLAGLVEQMERIAIDAIRSLESKSGGGSTPQTLSPAPRGEEGWVLAPAARDVVAERKRQVEVEGWTPAHDDEHTAGELGGAAACYALHTRSVKFKTPSPGAREADEWAYDEHSAWPWDGRWWKREDRRRNLVKAGALIIAEIERLDRLAAAPKAPGPTRE